MWPPFILCRPPWTFPKCFHYRTDFFFVWVFVGHSKSPSRSRSDLPDFDHLCEGILELLRTTASSVVLSLHGKCWPSFSLYCTWLQRASPVYGGHPPSAPLHSTETMIYWTGSEKFQGIPSANSLGFIALRIITDRSSVCYVAGYTTLVDV